MKIAVVAPMENPLPPKTYGGTELVVSNLTEELVALGHQVTLYASGDSKTSARLFPCVKRAVNKIPGHENIQLKNIMGFEILFKAALDISKNNYDIVHNNFEWPFLLFRDFLHMVPIVTTVHITLDRLIATESHDTYNYAPFRKSPLVTVSKSMQIQAPKLNYVGVVHNGIDLSKYSFGDHPQGYLLFLGRMSWQKGPVEAIRIAKATGHKLIMAARVGLENKDFFLAEVAPLIDGKQIVFVGEVGMRQKNKLLKGAKALLFPVNWQEPFGLAMVEAMACGTPVIARNRGSCKEVVVHGKTGFVCNTIDEMIEAVAHASTIDRKVCSEYANKHFSSRTMATNYIKVYEKVIRNHQRSLK